MNSRWKFMEQWQASYIYIQDSESLEFLKRALLYREWKQRGRGEKGERERIYYTPTPDSPAGEHYYEACKGSFRSHALLCNAPLIPPSLIASDKKETRWSLPIFFIQRSAAFPSDSRPISPPLLCICEFAWSFGLNRPGNRLDERSNREVTSHEKRYPIYFTKTCFELYKLLTIIRHVKGII